MPKAKINALFLCTGNACRTVLLRPHVSTLTDRYSERKEAAGPEPDPAQDLSAIAIAREPKMAKRRGS